MDALRAVDPAPKTAWRSFPSPPLFPPPFSLPASEGNPTPRLRVGLVFLVPTLCVGMPTGPLCGPTRAVVTTRSVEDGIPTQSVGTRFFDASSYRAHSFPAFGSSVDFPGKNHHFAPRGPFFWGILFRRLPRLSPETRPDRTMPGIAACRETEQCAPLLP